MRSTQPPASACSLSWSTGPGAVASRWTPRWSRPRWTTATASTGAWARWTRAHVADALAVWFPRTVALLDDDRDAVPAALHALVGFLAERDWLDADVGHRRASCTPRSTTARRPCTTRWPTSATATSARSGPSSCAATASRPPIRPPSPGSSSRCGGGEVDVDRDALAEVTRADAGAPEPEAGPATPELAARAAARRGGAARGGGVREAVARLRAVTRWVRTGRPLTARRAAAARRRPRAGRQRSTSTPSPATTPARADDLPETSLLVAWARQARLLRVVKGRLVPVRAAPRCSAGRSSCGSARSSRSATLGEHFGGSNVFGAPSLFGMSLGEALPMLLLDLYAAGGDPVPVELFHRRVRDAVNERFGCVVDDLAGDVEQRLWRRDVTAVLDALELLGAVHLARATSTTSSPSLPAATTPTRRWSRSPRSGCGASARCCSNRGCPRRWSASWPPRTSSTCACGWPGSAPRGRRGGADRVGRARSVRGRRRTSWRGCCGGRTSRRTGRWRSSRCGATASAATGSAGTGNGASTPVPCRPVGPRGPGRCRCGRGRPCTTLDGTAPPEGGAERERCRDPPGTRIAATLPELWRAPIGVPAARQF